MKLTSDISNGVCEQFKVDGVVCPPKLHSGLFTSAAVDNLDYNPTSTTAKESFYGTGISLFQHPSHESEGIDRGVVVIGQSTSSACRDHSVAPLPSEYTDVPPASIKTKEFVAPKVDGSVQPTDLQSITEAKLREQEWLKAVMSAITDDESDGVPWISWSAYHASIQEASIPLAAINALLPLFMDSAHSTAMIKHAMSVVQAAVNHLNPGQIPVLAADQPLFAIAKQIQWTWPNRFGEDNFVIMFGGLHIEMTVLKVCIMLIMLCIWPKVLYYIFYRFWEIG